MAKRGPIKPIYPRDPLEEYRVADAPKDALKKKPAEAAFIKKPLFLGILCLAVLSTISTIAFLVIILFYTANLSVSQKEYAALSQLAEELDVAEPAVNEPVSVFDAEMRRLNPDYICWIKIEDTKVDYPVLRAGDNEKYLHLAFNGEENVFGALFMDYRSVGAYVPNIIIFGHNAKSGDMFGGLRYFLDDEYRQEHPIITVKINDRLIEFEIFAARRTDVNDPAYCLDFRLPGSFDAFAKRCDAPAGAAQIITLSTCVSGSDADERVIVQGFIK
jgi:sortase B